MSDDSQLGRAQRVPTPPDDRVAHAILGCFVIIAMFLALVALAGGAFWIWRIALER